MSDESSGRPGRARRRTNTAPEPILGDLERERWRASFAAVRTQSYRFPRSSLPVELETDAVIAELEASGPMLAPGLAARVAAMGPRIASQLLDLVEREARNGGERPHSGALHALAMLGHLRQQATLTRLLELLKHPMESWLAPKLMTVLRCFGRALVDPAIAAYRSSDDPNHRALLVEVLTSCRVTDSRIRELCMEWLDLEPAFGADMLIDYGDPSAVEALRGRLNDAASPLDEEHVVAVCAAIEMLGGTLSDAEDKRAERALRELYLRQGSGA